ncbi:MAG: arylamine N-acetyltransferase family protein [Rhodanobacteraceae bacterium]
MATSDIPAIDLDAYLRRIGLHAATASDLPTLRAIVQAHVATIPFENLDPFLGKHVDLDFAAVQRKLVHDGRGGYCFEQNLLLGEALRAIGFPVTNLAARVLWGQPEAAITARSHMLLCIEIEARSWLADVGFGGKTPTGPLELVAEVEQATPHETFRLTHGEDGDWRVQVLSDDACKALYRFDMQPQFPIDYRASNYWTSTHPDSHFVTSLTAARAPSGRRLALRNREFTVQATGGEKRQRTLHDAAEIRAVLRDEFLIDPPSHPRLDEALNRLPD